MSAPVKQAFVGAGSNMGDRAATLISAVEKLRTSPGIASLESSSVYETEPVGMVNQPKFLNLVVGVETVLTPEDLLKRLQAIEQEFGRVRTERWGPRTLDLDLLLFEGETRVSEFLQLPHPRMLERGFVTVPLGELLTRPHFQKAHWHVLREKLAAQPKREGVRLFS